MLKPSMYTLRSVLLLYSKHHFINCRKMEIKQFEDKSLSHYSYALLSENLREIVLIDPSRYVKPYLDFAASSDAKIVGVIETHPHADFVSGHLELHENIGADIYCSLFTGALYPYLPFDERDILDLGEFKLKALNTPGHSADSLCIILEQEGKDKAVFTGDTLFIGDCGRPDLRENVGNTMSRREKLASQMYYSLRDKLMKLDDDVLVYPAHGAGTLCGKGLSDANSSIMGEEKQSNWSLQQMTESEFIEKLISGLPFVPAYFPYNVELNRKGALSIVAALEGVTISSPDHMKLDEQVIIVDTRPAAEFKMSHLRGAINIMAEGKFETWLGSIIKPEEPFYLAAADEGLLRELLLRTTKIGYENFIREAFVLEGGNVQSEQTNVAEFKENPSAYTILDVRNPSEITKMQGFDHAIHIPLGELRNRIAEIPTNKPVMVHCAGGYRSAAASSMLESQLRGKTKVYDLSTAVKGFIK